MAYNHALFRQIHDIITREPERHDQVAWESLCGTTRCVAGWAIRLEGVARGGEEADPIYRHARRLAEDLDTREDYEDLGAELLGLGEYEAGRLFIRAGNHTAALAVAHLAEEGAEFPWHLFDGDA